MRPIDKGECPKVGGVDKTVSDYKDWRRDLIDRIGYYCVYCNMPLSHQLHVEHVVAKSPLPGHPIGDLLAWVNMLLACEKCNNAKSNKASDETIHYLPEFHNPLLVFKSVFHANQAEAMIVDVKDGLNQHQQDKARKTIDDFELQNIDERGAIVDIRWMKRYKAWLDVIAARKLLEMAKSSPTFDAEIAGKCVATMATDVGTKKRG
jgi:hypothetical protein